jgi:hypothetical protein
LGKPNVLRAATLVLLTVLVPTVVLISSANDMSATAQIVPLIQIVNARLVNSQGVQVYLDGVNYKDQFKYLLYEKQGAPDWTTIESDFRTISSMGAKTIRIWFNWMYYEPTIGKLNSNRMLADVQEAVDLAKKYDLYLILTIYPYRFWTNGKLVTPWLQAHATTARTDPENPDFWLNDGKTSEKQRNSFYKLWQTLSARFKSEPTIAAYDLMNEPYNKYYGTAPKWSLEVPGYDAHYPLKSLYDLTVKSIRDNGDSHIIILDYNWVYSSGVVPLAKPSADPQLLYDIHMYYTAPQNPVQGWDVVSQVTGPWSGKTTTGTPVQYTYPDSGSAHDRTAIMTRLQLLAQAQNEGYVFYFGEFGFTQNSAYNNDVASLVVQLGFSGFAYFEYVPDEPIGTTQTIQPLMTYVRQSP